MTVYSGRGRFIIAFGDAVLFYVALFGALFIRYNINLNKAIVIDHLIPFSLLFVLWGIVFVIGGLYEKHVRVLKNRLPSTILRVQGINSVIAVVFFYAIPYFGIAPKTTLFIFLVLSFVLIVLWRLYGPLLFGQKAQQAIFIGSGIEFNELISELEKNTGYPVFPVRSINLDTHGVGIAHAMFEAIKGHPDATVVVADLSDRRLESLLPHIYTLVSKGYIYLEINKLYEEVFQRLPVSLLDDRWLIQNVSLLPHHLYDILKRIVDTVCALLLLIITAPLYLLVYVLIAFDDEGPLFFTHERIGQDGKRISIVKFRSMNDRKEITRVGAWLRKFRIDELPQLISIVRGEMSLIGPRPEIPALVEVYEKQIPYYALRHIVKPGLSGWAQIRQKTPPKFGAEIDATTQKISYDLFYIKHRSFVLDILIALQTIRELILSKGI